MITIGRANSADPGGAITAVVADPANAFADALGAAATSGADLVLTDGTWFTTPDQVNAYGTGTDFRVLLGQVTCSGDVEYQLNVQLNDGGIGGTVLQYVWNASTVDDNQLYSPSLEYPSTSVDVPGCTDMDACNFNPLATIDDGSCLLPDGCTDAGACNYDAVAQCDDGSCTFPGCNDSGACNYNAEAGCDDGSCEYTTCAGCTDPTACNYDETATIDDGMCNLPNGCTDEGACNYDETATCDDGTCEYATCAGCTNPSACNYDPDATIFDNSCEFDSCTGCTNPNACNFDPDATINDGSCDLVSLFGVYRSCSMQLRRHGNH